MIRKCKYLIITSLILGFLGCKNEPQIVGTWKMNNNILGLFDKNTYIEWSPEFDGFESPGTWKLDNDTLKLYFYGRPDEERKLVILEHTNKSIKVKNLKDSSIVDMQFMKGYEWAENIDGLSEPEKNFEKFWQDFDKNYAFFELRNVDWKAIYKKFRPLVNEATSDSLLYEYFKQMISPFDDGHTRLDRGREGERPFITAKQPSHRFTKLFSEEERIELRKITQETLGKNGCKNIKQSLNGAVSYCKSNDYSYVKFSRFFAMPTEQIESSLDTIINYISDSSYLIIDIRENYGGHDEIAYQFANRFADKKRIGHLVRRRNDKGHESFNDYKVNYLDPSTKQTYTKPIYLLTSSSVFSAAEIFLIAMRSLPHVTVIGNNTKGMLSEMAEYVLFNGWDYQLSSQRIYSSDTICYEKFGVPPDQKVLHTRQDLVKRIDPLIINALQMYKIRKID